MSSLADAVPRSGGDWRRYVRVAVLAVVVLSFAWGGVRLVDPLPKAPGAEPVDVEAPPAEIAYRAMRQTERGSYVLERYDGNATSVRHTVTLRVDAPEREVRGTFSWSRAEHGAATTEVYGSDAGTWYRQRRNGSAASPWEVDLPTSPYAFRFEDAVLDGDANVSVVASNASTVVVRVEDTDTAFRLATGTENATGGHPSTRGSVTLAVDREAGTLTWSRFRWSRVEGEEGNETREVVVTVKRFRRWGDVEVRRPAGLPYSFDTVLHDLRNSCRECGEGER